MSKVVYKKVFFCPKSCKNEKRAVNLPHLMKKMTMQVS